MSLRASSSAALQRLLPLWEIDHPLRTQHELAPYVQRAHEKQESHNSSYQVVPCTAPLPLVPLEAQLRSVGQMLQQVNGDEDSSVDAYPDTTRLPRSKASLNFIMNRDLQRTSLTVAPALCTDYTDAKAANSLHIPTRFSIRVRARVNSEQPVLTASRMASAASATTQFIVLGAAVVPKSSGAQKRSPRSARKAKGLKSKAVSAPMSIKGKQQVLPMTYEEKRRARECKVEGCANYIINRGLCFRHGGGKKCSEEECTASAKNAGKCWKHGGSVKCVVEDCDRRGKSRGYCWAHGGGRKCSATSCSKVAVSNGYCWAHGGGKRCAFDGCKRVAYERTCNYCVKHHDQLKDGNVTLEV